MKKKTDTKPLAKKEIIDITDWERKKVPLD